MNGEQTTDRLKAFATWEITPGAENMTGGIIATISLILSVLTLFGNLQGCHLAVFGIIVSLLGCLSLIIVIRKRFGFLATIMVTILVMLLITIPQFFGLGGQPACFT
jgi:hypothetical protein